ncbi:hypothetical protein PG996_011286 [Apiospora saccharicola]|uniref:Uncharacterized protein n=1 Tax=Apiospora saccharicola TaxID=335842 RepID=A0ABR1UHK1_9PEZI
MDFFQCLLPELRLVILEQIRSKRVVLQLIQASPAMLKQYIASKESITRAQLASDLDEEMVQDAMAIILFPSRMYPVNPSAGLVQGHLFASWASKRLPNPLRKPAESQNARLIRDLGRLHGRLLLFIEDYLTKATAVFPPREYVCLPALSPTQTHLTFTGTQVSPIFDVAHLTDGERNRLLKAFLRHHLMSLVYRHRDWHDNVRHCYRTELYQYGGRDFQPFEQEAIFCVRAYLESLYGTLFAQCSDSWLPELAPNSTSLSPHGLQYPDNLYFNPQSYASDFGVNSDDLKIVSEMAGFGLDLAWAFLRPAIAGRQGQDQLRSWFKKICKDRWRARFAWKSPKDLSPAVRILGSYQDRQRGPGMYRILYSRIESGHHLQRRMYRQRAWVFFDDARFYPSAFGKPHFPTPYDLDQERYEAGLDEGYLKNPARARALGRSQKWHDEQCGVSPDVGKMETAQTPEPGKECNAPLPEVVDGRFRISRPFWL